ncbi:MAG: hypothetical protein HC867_09540 [Bacteroidia bacterium]|nr:hypothetical protein [Bacteroidia bacterium]
MRHKKKTDEESGFTQRIFLVTLAIRAQNPVSWTFTAKKTTDKTYEIHMTATIQNGWHLYSQTQPDDAIAIPTTFTINTNPLFTLKDKVKEIGKLEKFHDKELDLSANQYSKKVNFVQVITNERKGKNKISPAMWNTVSRYCESHRVSLPTLRRVLSAGAPCRLMSLPA